MLDIIYEDNLIYIQIEQAEIPWLKVFTKEEIKEFSQCSKELRLHILEVLDIIEKLMIEQFKPIKINIASFGNYCPHVHFHIQARFENDSYYPEPTWGLKQRQSSLKIENIDEFYNKVQKKLQRKIFDN